MEHPCYTGDCRSTCRYGVFFFDCPYWQEWAAEQRRQEEEESDEPD